METYSCITSSSSSSSNHRHHIYSPRNLQYSYAKPAEAEQSMNKYDFSAARNYLQNTSRHISSSDDGQLHDELVVMETKSFDHAVVLVGLNSTSAGDHSGITSENTRDDVKHGRRKEAEDGGGDYDHDEEEKIDNGVSGGGGGGKKMKAVEIRKARRPRFAFQTRSQVDILDDGYRWRKYGQKAVKNNNFPRSYYRCTHQGCNVKKQVQRLSKDEEVVVTTYEGTHTHPIQTNTDNFEQILKQMQIYTTF